MPGQATTRERIAAAARELFVRDGVRATSLDRVAERAGYSRITVYRHFPRKAELVRDVVLGYIEEEVGRFEEVWSSDDPLEVRLGSVFVWSVETARANPLLCRMLETEPESVLPALTVDGEEVLAMSSAIVADRLRSEGMNTDSARMLAEMGTRLVVSLTLQPFGGLRLQTSEELRDFATRWIAPQVQAALAVAPGDAPAAAGA